MQPTLVVVTGATGYIGNRLVPRLLSAGYRVRALARSRDKLASRPWAQHPQVELMACDLQDETQLRQSLRGAHAVYYLVHSMHPGVKHFEDQDKLLARTMIRVAAAMGVQRLIYLSGLGQDSADLSPHLRSRHEVGRILKEGSVPVTTFRAAMIIGSGSASFEILRYLVERLPVMVTPRWVDTPCQPIAVRNVLYYLVACLQVPETVGDTFEIGQPEVTSYRELMQIYAQEAGLKKRYIVKVPVLTPRLSSYWIHLVTPVPASLAQPLARGLRNPVTVTDTRIQQLIPQQLFDAREAIHLALQRIQQQQVESRWTDAGQLPPAEWSIPGDPQWAGGTVLTEAWQVPVPCEPAKLWPIIVRIGGGTGWYHGNWLWRLRGMLDRLCGGVGLRRGRRHASELQPGDALDFWRVVRLEPNKELLLLAEMKLPGQATLEFKIEPLADGGSQLQQIARFLPRGLWGLLYWYMVLPLHGYVFRGMLEELAKAAGATQKLEVTRYHPQA